MAETKTRSYMNDWSLGVAVYMAALREAGFPAPEFDYEEENHPDLVDPERSTITVRIKLKGVNTHMADTRQHSHRCDPCEACRSCVICGLSSCPIYSDKRHRVRVLRPGGNEEGELSPPLPVFVPKGVTSHG